MSSDYHTIWTYKVPSVTFTMNDIFEEIIQNFHLKKINPDILSKMVENSIEELKNPETYSEEKKKQVNNFINRMIYHIYKSNHQEIIDFFTKFDNLLYNNGIYTPFLHYYEENVSNFQEFFTYIHSFPMNFQKNYFYSAIKMNSYYTSISEDENSKKYYLDKLNESCKQLYDYMSIEDYRVDWNDLGDLHSYILPFYFKDYIMKLANKIKSTFNIQIAEFIDKSFQKNLTFFKTVNQTGTDRIGTYFYLMSVKYGVCNFELQLRIWNDAEIYKTEKLREVMIKIALKYADQYSITCIQIVWNWICEADDLEIPLINNFDKEVSSILEKLIRSNQVPFFSHTKLINSCKTRNKMEFLEKIHELLLLNGNDDVINAYAFLATKINLPNFDSETKKLIENFFPMIFTTFSKLKPSIKLEGILASFCNALSDNYRYTSDFFLYLQKRNKKNQKFEELIKIIEKSAMNSNILMNKIAFSKFLQSLDLLPEIYSINSINFSSDDYEYATTSIIDANVNSCAAQTLFLLSQSFEFVNKLKNFGKAYKERKILEKYDVNVIQELKDILFSLSCSLDLSTKIENFVQKINLQKSDILSNLEQIFSIIPSEIISVFEWTLSSDGKDSEIINHLNFNGNSKSILENIEMSYGIYQQKRPKTILVNIPEGIELNKFSLDDEFDIKFNLRKNNLDKPNNKVYLINTIIQKENNEFVTFQRSNFGWIKFCGKTSKILSNDELQKISLHPVFMTLIISDYFVAFSGYLFSINEKSKNSLDACVFKSSTEMKLIRSIINENNEKLVIPETIKLEFWQNLFNSEKFCNYEIKNRNAVAKIISKIDYRIVCRSPFVEKYAKLLFSRPEFDKFDLQILHLSLFANDAAKYRTHDIESKLLKCKHIEPKLLSHFSLRKIYPKYVPFCDELDEDLRIFDEKQIPHEVETHEVFLKFLPYYISNNKIDTKKFRSKDTDNAKIIERIKVLLNKHIILESDLMKLEYSNFVNQFIYIVLNNEPLYPLEAYLDKSPVSNNFIFSLFRANVSGFRISPLNIIIDEKFLKDVMQNGEYSVKYCVLNYLASFDSGISELLTDDAKKYIIANRKESKLMSNLLYFCFKI